MKAQDLIGTARKMTAEGKGLLAMDQCNPTFRQCNAKPGIPEPEEARCADGKFAAMEKA